MRRSPGAALAALALLITLPYDAVSYAAGQREHAQRAGHGERAAPAPRPAAAADRPFGAECRSNVVGSHVVAYCHNPYPEADRLRLHIECDRWWDIDSDSRPVTAGPAMTVRLTGRCWKDVRSVWISHQR
ncbi:hypothetical protein [Streptomyces spectabilis]|uniref:Secreted protein n=1 Tax=Streptomyces spectabilis TaxID=68270 RepID=A0A516R536_STRST|nr:hypothetical protein [Streptomyces spectabilis]QDQ10777.1 hypothetical protein FH965_09460 [Streptomyces spectabilis]